MFKYSKRGYLVEWEKISKWYYIHLFSRGAGFLFDIAVPSLVQYLLMYIVGINIFISTLFGLIIYMVYFYLSWFLTGGKTMGMFLSGQRIINKTGFVTSNRDYIYRLAISIWYGIPYAREIVAVINVIFILFTRGFTITDLVSGTIVVSERTYRKLQAIENEELGGDYEN